MIHARILERTSDDNLCPFLVSSSIADLTALNELIETGTTRPVVDRVYPLAETARALAHVGQGHTAGKVVVHV